MLNLPAILNHEEERATILAELSFKEKKVDSSDWYGYIILLVTCLCNNDLSREYQSSSPTHSGYQESQDNLVLKTH